MNRRTKNLAVAGGAVVAVGLVAVNLLMAPAASVGVAPASGGATPGAAGAPDATAAGTSPGPSGLSAPAPPTAAAPSPAGTTRRSYAVGLGDLDGLPPDAAPGQALELWVTWEPPVTRGPRLQRLIGDVVLERIIPGAVPEGPVTVLLSVPAARVGDLIYAERYGRLSVVLPR
jgi:hypothetical protein